MRIKKICMNCSRIELDDNEYYCPVCQTEFRSVGFFLGKKLINMNGEQRRQWVEAEIGHPISDEIKMKYEVYCNQKMQESKRRHEEFIEKQILEQQAKNIARMQKESDKQNFIPKCPVCGSTNINKITLTKRAVKTAAFGALGAIDDAGKTWQCKNCGSKF